VLGYMGELGEDERALHIEVARYARDRGIEVLSVGTELYGVEPAGDPLVAVGILERGDAVLVKGSRSAGLETVAAALADA
jgi:UDP-N-acetylmuramoyl-tripeptide--D-alanyl-D-alanine ligase